MLLTVDADAAPAGVAPREKIKEGGHSTAAGAPAADYGAAGVYEAIDVRVPDIGDFKDVPVIEVHVKAGDTVKAEDSLITLESDKATMDVPSPAAGKVGEVKVKVGDKVAEGTLDPDARDRRGRRGTGRAARPPRPAPPSRRRAQPPTPAAPTSNAKCSCSAPVPAAIRRRSVPPISG